MRQNATHPTADPEIVRQLIREKPWAIISRTNNGKLIASLPGSSWTTSRLGKRSSLTSAGR